MKCFRRNWSRLSWRLKVKIITLHSFLYNLLKEKYSCILGVIILLGNNPVTLLIRAPDIGGDTEDNSMMIFLISQGKHIL